jgi:hypothetical protein
MEPLPPAAAVHPRWRAWAEGLAALALFLVPLSRFLRVAAARFDYPFDLEWTEGGVLLNVQRLLAGHPLYAAPSLDFIPFMYPPGYYALLAPLFRIVGPGYAVARLGSIAATLGTGTLIVWLARRAGNPLPLALAWGGLWFACFPLSGFFFDLVRVDAVLTFILTAAIAVLLLDVERPRPLTFALLVLLTVLAVLTKQNAVIYAGAIAAALAATAGWRRGAAFAAATAAALGLAVLVLQARSGGWFWFYTVRVPRSHGLEWERLLGGAWVGGVEHLPIAWLVLPGLAALAHLPPVHLAANPPIDRAVNSAIAPPAGERPSAPPWRALALVLAAAFAADLGMIGHRWSFDNVHMPLHATLVLAAAVTAPALLAATGSRRGAIPVWLLLGLALQVWATRFDLQAQIPDPAARAESERQVRQLASRGGRILAPEFPYLLAQAGLRPCFHISALADLLFASRHGLPVDLTGLLPEARSGTTGYLRGEARVPPLLARAFDSSRAETFGSDAEGWPTLVGGHVRPKLLVPRREP